MTSPDPNIDAPFPVHYTRSPSSGRRSQVVRQRSAKPSSAGSIPAVASNFPLPDNFAFVPTVESHGWYRLAPFRWSPEEEVLRRKEALPEGVVDLEIRHEQGQLRVDQTVILSRVDGEGPPAVRDDRAVGRGSFAP